MTKTTAQPEQETSGNVLYRIARRKPRGSWRTWLIGRPMPTADAPHQTIGKAVGLAVFGADALSSIAYAPQETLVILAAAGTQAFGYAFPISLIITVLLAIVTISYQQTIHAYPNGGGAYTVARENLGVLAALMAGAALLTDYALLAAVAISSGVAQIVSAFPGLFPFRVGLSVGLLILIAIANLRGVKESGNTFAIPTYFFLGMMVVTVGVGFFRYLTGALGVVTNPPPLETLHAAEPLTLFLLLRAFLEPFLEYVDSLCAILQPHERLTIVVPHITPEHWWHNLLHEQTAFWLRFVLLDKKGIVITEVPYQVD